MTTENEPATEQEEIDLTEEPEEVSVDPSDEADPIDDPQPLDRKGRRAQRGRNYAREQREAKEKAERELAEERQRSAAILQQVQQTMLAQQQQIATMQRPQQADPIDEYEKQLSSERALLHEKYGMRVADRSRPMTQEEQKDFERRAEDVERRIMDARIERRVRGMQPAQNAGMQAIEAQLAMEYPEISQNQQATTYAAGIRMRMIGEGKPNDLSTVRAALEETSKAFRFGKHKQSAQVRTPDPALRDKLQGSSRGASGGTEMPRSIVVTPEIKSKARTAFPHLDERKAVEKWVRTVGKSMLEKGMDPSSTYGRSR